MKEPFSVELFNKAVEELTAQVEKNNDIQKFFSQTLYPFLENCLDRLLLNNSILLGKPDVFFDFEFKESLFFGFEKFFMEEVIKFTISPNDENVKILSGDKLQNLEDLNVIFEIFLFRDQGISVKASDCYKSICDFIRYKNLEDKENYNLVFDLLRVYSSNEYKLYKDNNQYHSQYWFGRGI